jgi:Glycosyltransferase family 10 (fucosyltransferase) C-term
MESKHKTYKATTYGNFQLDLPEFNWGVSVSVDTFCFEDKSPYRVFWQTEPNEIINNEEKLIRNCEFYDLILTWNQRVLSECKNAKLFPAGSVWVAEPDTSQKKFQVSYLISSKNGCYGHQYRHGIFDALPPVIQCQAHGHLTTPLPVTKHRSPPYLPTKHSMLVPFQYAIVMENTFQNNNFTEKLNDALATKTIPIYWGCPNIENFYNRDGILGFDGYQDLEDTLKSLTPEFYASKAAAIEQNYHTALTYADRTGNIAKAIIESWTPKAGPIHSGEPNVPPQS